MAKTRPKRKIHHDQQLAKLNPWVKYQETLLLGLLATLFFGLVIYGGLGRTEKIANLTTEAQTALSQKNYQKSHDLLIDALLLAPNNPSLHFQLSQLYKVTNNWPEAQRELLVALELSPTSSSIQTELIKVQQTLAEPDKITAELNFWEKEVQSKPDYRDGWIQLAVRHYELYHAAEAKTALDKAAALDPNFETIKKLREIIK